MKTAYDEIQSKLFEYRITSKIVPRKWWQFKTKTEWYIENQFGKIGPFDRYYDAYQLALTCGLILAKDKSNAVNTL